MRIVVSTPSRLHFGIVDMRGDLGRLHGSVGVSIAKPRLVLEAEKAEGVEVKGLDPAGAGETINKIQQFYGSEGGIRVATRERIPPHQGFGSGTQVALALASAYAKLYQFNVDPKELAIALGRSRVSGIGTHGFMSGGFIVDGGRPKKNPETMPPLVFRCDVPEDWRFIVCIPDLGEGFSGELERSAFKRLKPPPADRVSLAARLVLLKMIPAIIERDIEAFGSAMTELDRVFGGYWGEVQHGTYSHPFIEECVEKLLANGAWGAGQSSWGPALYGLVRAGEEEARVLKAMRRFLGGRGSVFSTKADNRGARVTWEL